MRNVEELEERLSRPGDALRVDMARLDGDILVLGAGGKLGPSLVRLALRAVDGNKTVTAVSRFGKGTLAAELETAGAKVISADITDDAALAALPEVENVVFLVGSKFGSTGNEAGTWYTTPTCRAASPNGSATAGSSRSRPATSIRSRRSAAAVRTKPSHPARSANTP
jgi:hypothetical protein